jgi:hypothetical protein
MVWTLAYVLRSGLFSRLVERAGDLFLVSSHADWLVIFFGSILGLALSMISAMYILYLKPHGPYSTSRDLDRAVLELEMLEHRVGRALREAPPEEMTELAKDFDRIKRRLEHVHSSAS